MIDFYKPENLFHRIAWEQFILAMAENKHTDSEYVRQKSYEAYELELKSKNV